MIDPLVSIRLARPTGQIAVVEQFYVDGLGLDVLYRGTGDHDAGEFDLLMVGWKAANWHLELTFDPGNPVRPTPTVEDLLVLYLDGAIPDALIRRLVDAGGRRVPAHNAYWDRFGITIEDPDGYRLVLCERSWSNTR